MKIAIVAPIEESVPPKQYGGTEWIVYFVTHSMSLRGHQVDLYATGDSKREEGYTLYPTTEKAIRRIPDFSTNLKMRESKKFITFSKLGHHLSMQKYDLIHNHIGWRFLLFADYIKTPIITTHHGPLNLDYQNLVYRQYKDYPFVSISNNQRLDLPELNFVATVYNGIDINTYPYKEDFAAGSHMAFLARMSKEKGGLDAAETAIRTGHKLFTAAKVDQVDEEYYSQFAKYIDNDKIVFHGEIGLEEKIKLLQNARCLLVPVKWEEPFGLMFIESMACGTPVITYARGAAPEIVKDDVTGFLVNETPEDKRGDWVVKKTGVEGLCEAVEHIYALPDEKYREMRRASRRLVEENFTVKTMVENYEKVYNKLAVRDL